MKYRALLFGYTDGAPLTLIEHADGRTAQEAAYKAVVKGYKARTGVISRFSVQPLHSDVACWAGVPGDMRVGDWEKGGVVFDIGRVPVMLRTAVIQRVLKLGAEYIQRFEIEPQTPRIK